MVTENSNNDLKYLEGTGLSIEDIKNIQEVKTEEKKEEEEEKKKIQYVTE